MHALNGEGASLYDPTSFTAVQAAFVGPREDLYPNWPYPPIFLLIMAPFAALPYFYAFVAWDVMTLLSLLIVVYAISRRPAAVAVVLASPFYRREFPRRTKRVSDRFAAGCLTLIPRAAAGIGRRLHRMPYL